MDRTDILEARVQELEDLVERLLENDSQSMRLTPPGFHATSLVTGYMDADDAPIGGTDSFGDDKIHES